MTITRRHILAGAIAAPAIIGSARRGSAAVRIIKISHQFPGGTDRRRRFPRPPVPQVRRRAGEAHQRVDRRAGLSELVADEDRGAVLRRAQRRARYQPLSDLLRRRRVCRAQHRPDAGPGQLLQAGRGVEEVAGRPEVQRVPRREGRRHRVVDLAGRRLRQPRQADRQSGGCQGHEDSRRQPRDGHGAAGGRRHHAVDAVERALCRDADRRLRCRLSPRRPA